MSPTTADLLRGAAALIGTAGHCKGVGHDPETGAFCIVGALTEVEMDLGLNIDEYQQATIALREHLGIDPAGGCIAIWNDRDETTAGEVIHALVEAAGIWERDNR